MIRFALALLLSVSALAETPDASWTANAEISGRVFSRQRLGEAQGGTWMNGKIYLYGDLSEVIPRVGLVREYDENFVPTGRQIYLTKEGKPLLTHPTGLTTDPAFGTLLGDTVAQKGKIYSLDWERALQEGNLDHAVKQVIVDDAAVNGTRPIFVKAGGKTLLATADYGDHTPQIRLYDPAKLFESGKSSAPGVLVSAIEAAPFNQNLAWDAPTGTLTCVQNVVAGRGWQLDSLNLEKAMAARRADAPGVRVEKRTFPPHDELEGYFRMGKGEEVFITSSPADEIFIGKSSPTAPWRTKAGEMQVRRSGLPFRNPSCGPDYTHLKGKS